MLQQPAKALAPEDVRRALDHVRHQRHPNRNRVMILLSFKAGLRACEIAGLTWPMALTSDGVIASHLSVARHIAKCDSGRDIPLNIELARALRCLHRHAGRPRDGSIVPSERGGHITAGSIVNWFATVYRELGLIGCSSHSVRRTFIARAARLLATSGGSLRDVQELAGHRAITTTERYIVGDRDAQRRLIARI